MQVFTPDYNVSVAEFVIPGADLSQHLSTAGHEASGTGNMKFLMNGCLLLATADGSTIEIAEELGADNMFSFGTKVHEVAALREKGRAMKEPLQFARVLRYAAISYSLPYVDIDMIITQLYPSKTLVDSNQTLSRLTTFPCVEWFTMATSATKTTSNHYAKQWRLAAAVKAFVDKKKWTRMSILSAAASGRFSSDRTIQEYAEQTWGIEPCRCPI
ncbi:hypothetical protein QQ045_008002 [Rhodiola kirilowii]